MIVYRMSKIFIDKDIPELPDTEFSAQFNQAGWTPEGTMASEAYASFDELQRHMNQSFSPFADQELVTRWKNNFTAEADIPLSIFVESGWVMEWSDPDFRPLDEYDESDASASAELLERML